METYILSDIDKFGNFSLTLNGISPQNFCIFSRKTKEAGIPMRIVELFGVKKTLASTYEHFAAVKNILTEIGMSPQVTSYTFIPVSSRDNKDIVIDVESYSPWGMHITVSKFSPIFYYIIKNLFANKFSSIGSIENDFIITSLNYENLKNFIDVLNKSNFNTTSMTPFLNLVPKSMDDNKNPIVLAEQSDVKVNGWLLKITINYGANDPIDVNEKLYKMISFVFPLNITSLNSTDMNEKVAEVSVPGRKVIYFRCQYRDLKTLQLLLEKNNFNTVAMEKVIDSLVSSKALNKTRIDGEMDGVDQTEFQKYISYYESNFFYNTSYSDNEKHFFPAQIKGIEFLYSRQGALLGDAVGVGKTLMSVVAADIRMKTSGGSCLIITKSAVVPQLCIEIQKITKETSSEISVNYATPSKWTVIPYNIFEDDTLFNNEPIRKIATRILSNYAKANRFTVCILDEIHMIKNGDPSDRDSTGSLDHIKNHRTFNVQEITKHIPFVWGASATIVANKPKDLFNQLKAINHNIGNMDYRKFVEQFDSKNSDSLVDKFKKSDMIRDLMTDQGIYMRRSKSEVNENMPEMEVVTKRISLTPEEVAKIMSGVKGSKLERPDIDQTSIIRKRIAIAKVDNTVDLAESVLTAGRKVAVFTAHTDSLTKIKDDLGLILDRVYPGGNKTVASIDGSQNKDQRQAQIQGFKSKGSNMMAIVISIDAGGTGLDFPNILTDVIVNDFDWSPSDDDQSIGRFYRINSRQKVNVTYVIAENTLDRKYFDLLNEKKKIAERIQTLSDEESNEIAKMSGSSSARLLEIRKRKYQELLSLEDLNKEYRQGPTS